MKRQTRSREPRLTGAAKADLRRRLPALLEAATTSAEARAAALKACVAVSTVPPPSLLEPSILATALTERDLVGAFNRLTTSTTIRDCSAVLAALRGRLDRELTSGSARPQDVSRVATSVLQKVLRLVM